MEMKVGWSSCFVLFCDTKAFFLDTILCTVGCKSLDPVGGLLSDWWISPQLKLVHVSPHSATFKYMIIINHPEEHFLFWALYSRLAVYTWVHLKPQNPTGLLWAHFDAIDAQDIKVKVRALGDYTSVWEVKHRYKVKTSSATWVL
jgi:hypothetical protein